MKSIFVTILLSLSLSISVVAQDVKLLDLGFLSDVMINASKPEHRVEAHQVFYDAFKKSLSEEGSWNVDYKDLEWISIQKPMDNSFRLFTWQIIAGDNDYQYYGFLQQSDGAIYELIDQKETLDDIEYLSLSPEEWYGVLYYEIKEYTVNGSSQYLLFGYDGHSKHEKIKIAEVLSFVDGLPIFGVEAFKIKKEGVRDDIRNRIKLNYSVDGNVTLNYNEGLGIIMHDHLISRMGQFTGQGETMVPDGSYEGYKLEDGFWVYNEKIFDHIYQNAPIPVPSIKKGEKSMYDRKN